MNYSVIITAWKEPETIKKAVKNIIDSKFNIKFKDLELIITCPDEETWISALSVCKKYNFKNVIWCKDPQKGKPNALNIAFKIAKNEIIILTDGEVFMEKNSIPLLLEHFNDKKIGAVTGRPKSADTKNFYMGYTGHFYADVAHHKRMRTMYDGINKNNFSKSKNFFLLSGYIYAIRNIGIKIPPGCLDDEFISYYIFSKGYTIKYEPDSIGYVKYPKNLSDWYKQRLRNIGWHKNLIKNYFSDFKWNIRSFTEEVKYALWFPFSYIKNIKELIWTLTFYPIRLFLWIRVLFEKNKVETKTYQGWGRVESTK